MTTTTSSGPDPMVPPPDAHHIVVPGGEGFIWLPHPGIVVQKASGLLSLPMAEAFGVFYRQLFRSDAHVHVFNDYEQLTSYTRDAREFTTAITLEFLGSLRDINVLHSSKHLALGISSFKHQVGDDLIHTYSDRASFLRSYEAAVLDAPRLGWT